MAEKPKSPDEDPENEEFNAVLKRMLKAPPDPKSISRRSKESTKQKNLR